jgi:hypothetical protein
MAMGTSFQLFASTVVLCFMEFAAFHLSVLFYVIPIPAKKLMHFLMGIGITDFRRNQ